MRAIASLTGLMIAVSLGACASPNFSVNIPSSITLFGSEPEPAKANPAAAQAAQQQPQPQKKGAVATTNSAKTLDASHNAKKAQSPKSQPSSTVAANQPAPAAEKPAEKENTGSILGNMSVFSSSEPDAAVQTKGSPVETYSMLAQQIHACWLKPGAPMLPNHGLHAEVTPNEPDTAKIIIFEKAPDNKRGLQVFRITINGGSGGSTITSENRRLDAKLDGAFKGDLTRWAKGDTSCK
jgi:hypothetical protein